MYKSYIKQAKRPNLLRKSRIFFADQLRNMDAAAATLPNPYATYGGGAQAEELERLSSALRKHGIGNFSLHFVVVTFLHFPPNCFIFVSLCINFILFENTRIISKLVPFVLP